MSFTIPKTFISILDRIDQLLEENLRSENSLPSLLAIENKKLQNFISEFKEPEDIKKLNFEVKILEKIFN